MSRMHPLRARHFAGMTVDESAVLGRFSGRRNAEHDPDLGSTVFRILGRRVPWRAILWKGTPWDKRHNTECQTPSAPRFEASSQDCEVLCVLACACGLGNGSPANAGGWGRFTKCRVSCGGMDLIRSDQCDRDPLVSATAPTFKSGLRNLHLSSRPPRAPKAPTRDGASTNDPSLLRLFRLAAPQIGERVRYEGQVLSAPHNKP